jgi:basic membrane protein A
VGIILGTQSDLLDGFRFGFRDGVRAVSPSVAIDEQYVQVNSTGGFSDPARAAEIAHGMYGNGTDVIYTVAGFSGTGAITEAKMATGRYIIGVDADQAPLGPSVVLASAVKRLDRVVFTGIADHMNGSFSSGYSVFGLKDDVTGLVFNPKFEKYNGTVAAFEDRAREAEGRYITGRPYLQ